MFLKRDDLIHPDVPGNPWRKLKYNLVAARCGRLLNASLAYAVGQGMRLTYLDRSTYCRKTDPDVVAALVDEFGPCYVVPEGGSNGPGVRECAELPEEIDVEFDVICCACGTGGTLAGIAAGLPVSSPGSRKACSLPERPSWRY